MGSLTKMVGYFLAPVLSVLVTVMTGLSADYDQGFPLHWRNVMVCPGGGIEIPCYELTFSLVAFALDALFFTAIGYGLFLGYARFLAGKQPGSTSLFQKNSQDRI